MKLTTLDPELINFKSNLLALTSNEDQILLDNCAVSIPAGSQAIFACRDYMELYGAKINGEHAIEIIEDYADFEFLFHKAMELYDKKDNYITGLKMILGADSASKKIVLGYRPLVMKRAKVVSSSTITPINSYNIAAEGLVFMYNPTKLPGERFEAFADYSVYTKEYADKFYIRRNKSEINPTKYIPDVDTDSAIFSFQEIFTMIDDNSPEKKTLIFNCMVEDYDPVATRRNSFILSPNIIPTLNKSFDSAKNMYTDLAHLCPPNCNQPLKYKIKPNSSNP